MPDSHERLAAQDAQGLANTLDERDPEPTAMKHLMDVARTTLEQAIDLVETHLTTNEQLSADSKYLPGSTIGWFGHIPGLIQKNNSLSGKHLRHARDHFMLLIDCMVAAKPHILSYDVRIRNVPMETSLDEARSAMRTALENLETIVSKVRLDEPITINAVTPHMQILETTFGREVCPSHTFCGHVVSNCVAALVLFFTCCTPLVDGECNSELEADTLLMKL